MNKYVLMQKKLVRQGIISVVIVLLACTIMLIADMLAEGAAKDKDTAVASVSADENQLRDIQSRIDLSSGAEKQYAEIQLRRMEPSFAAKTDALVKLLQESKATYRLSGFKPLNLPSEVVSKVPRLTDNDYDVMVREGITLEFDSISDLHAQSFIRHLLGYAPGFVRLDSIDMQRKGDLSPQAIAQLKAGQNLGLVSTKLELTWVGIKEKQAITKKDAAPVGDKQ